MRALAPTTTGIRACVVRELILLPRCTVKHCASPRCAQDTLRTEAMGASKDVLCPTPTT